MRVLIVDDCELSAGMLAVVLEIYGHQVRLTRTLGVALRVAADFEPDLVLLAVAAPVTLAERDAAQEMRAAAGEPQIFALCATPHGLSDREQGLFDRVLSRPVRFGQLKPFLDTPLSTRHAIGQRVHST